MTRRSLLDLRVPPVALALGVAGAMWLTASRPDIRSGFTRTRILVGAVLAVFGLLTAAAGLRAFRRARTTTNPLRPAAATAFVAEGPYRFTRHPMYLGLLSGLVAWAVLLGSPLNLAWLVGFVAFLTRFQIVPEERAMLARFGEAYSSYLKTVRRWL
jgi:protein-S-isoprenylcysteine O-methyltransferase Ste14